MLGEREVADEFVEDDAFAEDGAGRNALAGGNAHEPSEGGLDPAEEELQRLGDIGTDPAEGEGEEVIEEGDGGDEGDEHSHDVDGERHAIGRASAESVNAVDGLFFDLRSGAVAGGADFFFGEEDFGHHEGGWGADDGGGEEVAGGDAEGDVGSEDAAGDGGHAADHESEDFATGHGGEVGFDDEWGFGLTHEDVGGGCEAFTAAGAEDFSHHASSSADDELEDAVVIKGRGEGGDEDDGAGNGDGEDESVLRPPFFGD